MRKNGFIIKLGRDKNGNDMFKVMKYNVCYLLFKQNQEGMFLCNIKKIMLDGASFWIGDGLKYREDNTRENPYKDIALAETTERRQLSEAEIMRVKKANQIHRSLSHCSDKVMSKMIEGGLIKDISVADIKNMRYHYGPCQICLRAKMTNTKKKNVNKVHTTVIGEVIHVDLMYIGKNTYLVCVDEASGFLITIPMKDKSKEMLLVSIKRIVTYLNGFGKKTKRICCDRESGITALIQDLSSFGIELYRSSTEGHDARIERQIRTLKSKIRASAMDMAFPLPKEWIDHLVLYVTQAQNLVINNKTGLNSPFHLMCGERNVEWPNQFSFGDVVLMKVPYVDKLHALEGRSEYGIVIGRDLTSNHVFTLFRIESKSIVYRNIMKKMNFNQVPEGIKHTLLNMNKNRNSLSWIEGATAEESEKEVSEVSEVQSTPFHDFQEERNEEETKTGGERDNLEEKHESLTNMSNLRAPAQHLQPIKEEDKPNNKKQEGIQQFSSNERKENENAKHSQAMIIKSSGYNNSYSLQSKEGIVEYSSDDIPNREDELMNEKLLCMNERKEKGSVISKEKEINVIINDIDEKDDTATVLMSVNKANDAFGFDSVRAALLKEIKQLHDTGTFAFISKTVAQKMILIPTTVVMNQKHDGSVKARIVAMGNHQDRSLYRQKDISSPAVRTETLFLVLAVTASKHSRLYSFDVAGAYLHSNLPEERNIAIRFTREVSELMNELYEDVERDVQGFVYGILKKGLYGLLEAGNLWNKLLTDALMQAGYKPSSFDPCLFWRRREKPLDSFSDLSCYLIVVQVDDLLFSSPEPEEVHRVRTILESMFGKMKFHDEDSFEYRGITIHQDKNEIKLEQKKKVEELIKDVLGSVDC